MEKEIKRFCIDNSKKEKIDFSVFQNPINLYNKYGNNYSFNKFKGDIFEMLLTELFCGNGYIVDRVGDGGNDGGCDLMVKHPKDDSIRFILQAKNWKESINISDIDKEYGKFKRNYKKQNKLNNHHFCFVAWKYVKGINVKIESELHINIWNEQDIINNLLKKYKSQYPKYPSILLEPYQKTAFDNIIRFWKNNKRCYVEHSTGTGKTYIIAKLVEVLLLNAKNKILILSPSAYINDRINELLRTVIPSSNTTLKFKVVKVVNILTYQYLYHNSSVIPPNNFTHIIMDEAHRAGAPGWHEKGLLPIINNNAKIIGLSATMERYSSGIDVKEFLENNCAGELSLFRAITEDILPSIGKYVYSVQDIDSKINDVKLEVKTKYKKFPQKKEQVLSILDAKQIKDYSIQNILYKYYSSIQYQKIIAFCEGYEHVNEIRRLLDNTFVKFSNVKIEKITSKQSKKENKLILSNFSNEKPNKNQINIIVAIDMLNEGIDVSGIDSIMLFRKTESPRVYLQQIGRVLRSHGKDNPLIFDCVLNFQNVKINLTEESQKEVNKYQKSLVDFGFTEIEIPKSITIKDEVREISKIIEEVEAKLNFYRSYEHAKEAVQKLGINSESEYRKSYRKDLRLPSKPHRTYHGRGWIDDYDFFGTERPNFYSAYNKAKNATQKLGIKTFIEYRKRYKEDPKLPSQPDRTYSNVGWVEWSDYFGTTDISNYKTYEEAKQAARFLKIKSYTDYRNRYAEDPRLPFNPDRTYNNKGWKNFNDFLGVKTNLLYPTLKEAKQAVSKLIIKTEKEYRLRHKEDTRLPGIPHRFYKNKGWIDNYDFFNKNKNRPDAYLTYGEAKKAVRLLSIKTRKEYYKRYKEDPKLPSNPKGIYENNGWSTFYNFLGIKSQIFYETNEEAKTAVQKSGIKTRKEYIEEKRYKGDPKLPSQPNNYYKNKGWVKWEEFIVIHYLTYEEAKEAVQKLGIKTRNDYIGNKLYKRDSLLPSVPEKTYKNKGWIDWYHFLGTKAPNIYKTYHKAKIAVQRLNIQSMKEYKKRRHEDKGLPSSPSECYKNKGWKTSSDFLNIEKTEHYSTYQEAKKAAQNLGIKSGTEYRKLYKQAPKLASTPEKLYKSKGWKDWCSFLGTEPINIYPTYAEAKFAAEKLNIKTGTAYRKQYKQDSRLPSTPKMKYENNGWIDFYHFLGFESPNKYSTYEEAKKAVHRLKIKSRQEYCLHKRYLEDKGLTCNPDRKFKNNGWVSWEDFLGF